MATKKKTAMVKPKPKPPELTQTEMSGSHEDLAFLLGELGVDRPYTILSYKDRVYQVHFYGDAAPCTVKMVNGKPSIVKSS
jgi:hypothetical protein